MKKLKQIAFVYALLLACPMLLAKLGCLDNSWHLKEKYDHKNYHPVSCSCPCDSYKAQGLSAQNQDKCLECSHRHDPKPIIFMKKIVSHLKGTKLPDGPKEALEKLIDHWKASNDRTSQI